MTDQTSPGATGIIKDTFKVFVNLLKEFPRDAAGDFIYDDATIKKIKHAADSLAGMETLSKKKASGLKKDERIIVGDAVTVLSSLLGELPRRSSDEFSYDRMIHQKVEEAREIIVKLGGILP